MYSSITNVNILTDLLIRHGLREAVICPGSQNAPIAHNLCACCAIRCIPVTDERTAGFVALGLALRLERPVAVCVTSGSALLNLLPAVAEASYQQVPLVVISADRAQARIDQLDGQTLPQPDALGRFVRCAVNLPEPHDAQECTHCNRLVNEALLATAHHGNGPVHINVPISRNLHVFQTPQLPEQRFIRRTAYSHCRMDNSHPVAEAFLRHRRRLIVLGQLPRHVAQTISPLLKQLSAQAVILHDCLGAEAFLPVPPDVFRTPSQAECRPDFILYLGGTLVDKPLLHWLQRQDAECWVVNRTGHITEVAGILAGVVEAGEEDVLRMLAGLNAPACPVYISQWHDTLAQGRHHLAHTALQWSQALAVSRFEARISALPAAANICYANSSSIRLANLFATAHRQSNRGLNGIEGSLSTAVGIALAEPEKLCFCVIGDLSFFYDHNALWTTAALPNMRILLLNNAGGGIFSRFRELQDSPARDNFIMARHACTAEGICTSYHVAYHAATDTAALEKGLDALFNPHTGVPQLLEVFTDMEQDNRMRQLLNAPDARSFGTALDKPTNH